LNILRNYHSDLSDLIRGADLYGLGDEKLGSVDDAIVHSESGDLRYLIVNAGWLKSRRFLIPADQVYAYGKTDDDFYVNLSKSDAEALPDFQEERLALGEAFTIYQREYQNAWRSPVNATGLKGSPRLLHLKQRIQDVFSGTRNPSTQGERKAPRYTQASYSGSTAQPTGVYGIYSDRKDVDKTISTLKENEFSSTDISVVFPNPEMSAEFAVEKSTKAPEGALAGGSTGFVIGGTLGQRIFLRQQLRKCRVPCTGLILAFLVLDGPSFGKRANSPGKRREP
jgi:hypothetical protein